MNPKQPKHMHPQRLSWLTKNKKVIHRFLITTTHTAPICQMTTLKHKIIQYMNLAMSCYPHKKKTILLETFTFQMPFQVKMEVGASQILWWNDQESNFPLPLRPRQRLSLSTPPRIQDWIKWRKEKEAANSQSLHSLKKHKFHTHISIP